MGILAAEIVKLTSPGDAILDSAWLHRPWVQRRLRKTVSKPPKTAICSMFPVVSSGAIHGLFFVSDYDGPMAEA